MFKLRPMEGQPSPDRGITPAAALVTEASQERYQAIRYSGQESIQAPPEYKS
jgi:hypothetical protein